MEFFISRQIQFRRGDAAANDNFIGAIGEVTMDTTNNTLRVHDGVTVGGITLAKQDEVPDLSTADYVIKLQAPTADNNYTWYRKYKSGWVEQGGYVSTANDTFVTITLPIEMSNTAYQVQKTGVGASSGTMPSYRSHCITNRTTTSFQTFAQQMSTEGFMWYLYGVAK
jgi:hypothetical protein